MSAFTDWLADTGARRVLLAEVDYYDESSSPSASTAYFASETYITGSADTPANTLYQQRIAGSPFFRRVMSPAFAGRTFLNVGQIDLNNIDGALDEWLDYGVDGRQIVLKLGDPSWSIDQFQTILTGRVKGVEVGSDAVLSLIIKDEAQELNEPIQGDLVSAGEQTDQPIPLTFGEVYNIRPIKVPLGTSPETYKYQIHDGPVKDVCMQLYVNGEPSAISVTKDNANGTFTLASDPQGDVTVDARGNADGSSPSVWDQTPGEIFSSMAARAGKTANTSSMAALDSAAPYLLGVYLPNRINAVEAIDELLPAGWWWDTNRAGELVAELLQEPATSVLTIDEVETHGDIGIEVQELPVWRARVGYKKNHNVQQDPQGTVTDDRREFLKVEYRTAKAEDSSVLTKHLDARDPDQYESHIIESSDAVTEASRLLEIMKVQRFIYTVECFVGPYQLNIGDTVTLKDRRFGLDAGVDCVVIGFAEYLLENRVELKLWR